MFKTLGALQEQHAVLSDRFTTAYRSGSWVSSTPTSFAAIEHETLLLHVGCLVVANFEIRRHIPKRLPTASAMAKQVPEAAISVQKVHRSPRLVKTNALRRQNVPNRTLMAGLMATQTLHIALNV